MVLASVEALQPECIREWDVVRNVPDRAVLELGCVASRPVEGIGLGDERNRLSDGFGQGLPAIDLSHADLT